MTIMAAVDLTNQQICTTEGHGAASQGGGFRCVQAGSHSAL